MILQIDNQNEITSKVIGLLNYLNDQIDEKDINSTVFQLQSLGFRLESINKNNFDIIGTFKNNEFVIKVCIPRYKIDEDIIEQLRSLVDEFNIYNSERKKGFILDLDSNEINWDEVYNTPGYAKVSLETAIELLFHNLKKELRD